MTRLRLNSDEKLWCNHVKLTSVGLTKIIDATDGLISPFEAINALPPVLQDASWLKNAKNSWKKGMC